MVRLKGKKRLEVDKDSAPVKVPMKTAEKYNRQVDGNGKRLYASD